MGRKERRGVKAAARKTYIPREIVVYGARHPPPQMAPARWNYWYNKMAEMASRAPNQTAPWRSLTVTELNKFVREFQQAGVVVPIEVAQHLATLLDLKKRAKITSKSPKRESSTTSVARAVALNAFAAKMPRFDRISRITMPGNVIESARPSSTIRGATRFLAVDPKTGISVSNAASDIGTRVNSGYVRRGESRIMASSMLNTGDSERYYGRRFSMLSNPPSDTSTDAYMQDIGKLPPPGFAAGGKRKLWQPPPPQPQTLFVPPVGYTQEAIPTVARGRERSIGRLSTTAMPGNDDGNIRVTMQLRGPARQPSKLRRGDYINPPPPPAPAAAPAVAPPKAPPAPKKAAAKPKAPALPALPPPAPAAPTTPRGGGKMPVLTRKASAAPPATPPPAAAPSTPPSMSKSAKKAARRKAAAAANAAIANQAIQQASP